MIPTIPLKDTKAFEPIKVGQKTLSNRIVYAPATRNRALPDHTPSDLALKYYDDRSRFPGSLIVTEGTLVSPKFGLYNNVPGIYTKKHADNWRHINDKIHANGLFSSIQFWALGRVADPQLTKEAGCKLIAPSAIYESDDSKANAEKAGNPIHEPTEEEIKSLILNDYTNAAKLAMEAGFDFVEIHGANGYIVDQFFQVVSNQRTDKYGGSVENRSRFALELIDHLSLVIGADKIGIRLSPWSTFQAMGGDESEVHPISQFGYFLGQLQKRANEGQEIAYVSVVEPRVWGIFDTEAKGDNAFVRSIWKGIILRTGNYTYDAPDFKTLQRDINDGKTLVGFARYFTSNPDLVQRLHDGSELTPYERDTFYVTHNWGYNTWAKAGQKTEFDEEAEKSRTASSIKA